MPPSASPEGSLDFLPTRQVRYGPGSISGLPAALDGVGATRVLICTTRSLVANGDLLARVRHACGPRLCGQVSDLPAHVPVAAVEDAASRARAAGADTLVSFGGGSVIDAAKAIAARLLDQGRPVAHIAIPTTLSGAEFADHFGLTGGAGGAGGAGGRADSRPVKVTHTRIDVTPSIVILDAHLTAATPASLWSGTAIKALDHAIEGLLCAGGPRPVLDELALAGIAAMAAALPASVHDGATAMRQRCQIAAWQCYFAPASLTLGLSHRIGHVLGGTYGVPHGVTSAVTLPAVMQAMLPTSRTPLASVAEALGGSADADAAAPMVRALCAELGLPGRLRDTGIDVADLDRIAADVAARYPAALGQLAGGMAALRQLLADSW